MDDALRPISDLRRNQEVLDAAQNGVRNDKNQPAKIFSIVREIKVKTAP